MRREQLQPGDKVGKLTLVSDAGFQSHKRMWRCVCECGVELVTRDNALKSGNTKSCGCLVTSVLRERNWKSGLGATPEAQVWRDIRKRCNNPKDKSYPNYGGRGIQMHDSWSDFEVFIRDVGFRPWPKATLDRIDNSRGYEPGNVRWVPMKTQQRNKRTNRSITIDGVTQIAVAWAEELGMAECTVCYRATTVNQLGLPDSLIKLDSKTFKRLVHQARRQQNKPRKAP